MIFNGMYRDLGSRSNSCGAPPNEAGLFSFSVFDLVEYLNKQPDYAEGR